MPSKDGLGPKIWTGIQFLPRFVRTAEVEGEGMCYFYDDGSHCKTVIEGEMVNALWGVTKAGKPRKRLAIACVTCREKKIKCEPDYPRCVQCEKFGRIFRFKNAPRGGHNTSPSTPPRRARLKTQGNYASALGWLEPPISPRTSLPQQTPPEMEYKKRQKIGPDAYASSGEPSDPSLPATTDHAMLQPAPQWPPPVAMPRMSDDVLRRACRTDPCASNAQSINAVLTQFFGQIDNTMVMRFFPEKVFRLWVSLPAHEKSQEDLMVLYSVLALDVVLSEGSRAIAHEYAQVARYAQRITTHPSLQLVQSRILLTVYHIATAQVREASEFISSAAAAAASASLHLNRERERASDEGITIYPFGMTSTVYSEARRRTLWSLFMLERVNTVLPNRPVMINADDIYVRLPADSESFEKQVDASMPFFDPDEPAADKLATKSSELTGYLLEMVHIWSSCQSVVSRLTARPSLSETSNARVRSVAKRAHDWHDSLPSRLIFNSANLGAAAFSGKVGSFLTMHLLYHQSLIYLNRYHASAAALPRPSRLSQVEECRGHALRIFDIANCLNQTLRVRPSILKTFPPIMAETVVTAVDVLTARGSMASINDLIQTIRAGKAAVDSSTAKWKHAQAAREAIDVRLRELMNIYHSQGSRPASPADGYRIVLGSDSTKKQSSLFWTIPVPIEIQYSLQMDVVYYAPV